MCAQHVSEISFLSVWNISVIFYFSSSKMGPTLYMLCSVYFHSFFKAFPGYLQMSSVTLVGAVKSCESLHIATTHHQQGKTTLSHNGLNPAHVPYQGLNNPTLGEFCFTMMGRADIEGSYSFVERNSILGRCSYYFVHSVYMIFVKLIQLSNKYTFNTNPLQTCFPL